jgi:hypothetical protein
MPEFSIGRITKAGTNRSDRLPKVGTNYSEPAHPDVRIKFALDLVQEASLPLALALHLEPFQDDDQQCEKRCHFEQ